MLGDSVRRHAGKAGSVDAKHGRRPGRWRLSRRGWGLVLAAVVLPLGAGYLLATFVLFPKPAVVAAGTPVPQLVGMTLLEAELELGRTGLGQLLTTELPDGDVPAGTITAQSPLAGQQARPGSPVRVAVSSGAPVVAVPDVLGFSFDRASMLLRGLGFEVDQRSEESMLPAGRVSSIEPGPGALLTLPARIRVFVSSGRPLDPDTAAADTIGVPARAAAAAVPAGWPANRPSPMFAGASGFPGGVDGR